MNLLMLFVTVTISSSSALAQINENGLVPNEFKTLPNASQCEAWKIGIFDQPDTLAGKAQIAVLLENEPLVTVQSPISDLNFSFGRRIVGGKDRTQSTDYCAYFFDSSTQNFSIRYFCSDLDERSWMNNTYSSISFSAQAQGYSLICKKAKRGDGFANARSCWKLKNCR